MIEVNLRDAPELKKAVGYKSPSNQICKNCQFFSTGNVSSLCSSPIKKEIHCCTYLERLFGKKNRLYGRFLFNIDPEGTCSCFKKNPKQCGAYNQPQYCSRRKCHDPRYDDKCMEIV